MQYQEKSLKVANNFAKKGDIESVFEALRGISIDDYVIFMFELPPKYKALRKLLPTMPTIEEQVRWAGTSGRPLMRMSAGFMRAVSQMFEKITGRSFSNVNILDYGCGWGRLTRCLYYYTSINRVYCADPMQSSLELCKKHKLQGAFELCDASPSSLPFDKEFDLIISYSVFTHLPEDVAIAALKVLAKGISDRGVLVFTIRPIEYWGIRSNYLKGYSKTILESDHNKKGYAFMPHPTSSGEKALYGDTSISIAKLERMLEKSSLKLITLDRLISDPYQLIVWAVRS